MTPLQKNVGSDSPLPRPHGIWTYGILNERCILKCNEVVERTVAGSSVRLTAKARAPPTDQLLNGQPNVPLLSPSVPSRFLVAVVAVRVEFISRE